MIKQFTRFVTEALDPAKAMHHFDQFLDKLVEIGDDRLYDRTLSLRIVISSGGVSLELSHKALLCGRLGPATSTRKWAEQIDQRRENCRSARRQLGSHKRAR
jgi:hypothetical protein